MSDAYAVGMDKVQRCIVKDEDNMPCNRVCIYLSAEQAQEQGRGEYSGWRHASPIPDENHNAVPKSWVG